MMKKIGLVLIGFILGAGSFFGVAIAKMSHFGDEWQSGKVSHKIEARISDKLELNASQEEALSKLMTYAESQRATMKGNFGDTKSLFQAQLSADKVDRDEVISSVTERLDSMKQEVPIMVNHAADFMDSLTTEQRKQIETMLTKHDGKRGWGRHHGKRDHHDKD